MKVSIIAVGKIKEKFFSDAIDEYKKRISRFAELEIIELADERIPDNASDKDIERIKSREGEKILAKIKPQSYVAALCIEGRLLDSVELAETMREAYMRSGCVTFIIGGSLGLSDAVKRRADLMLSHMLMRVVLSEQIYRAFMINSGAAYHK